MITVYKGNDKKIITKGAYETFYKPLGYKVVIEATEVKETKTVEKKQETKTVVETKVEETKEAKVNEINDAISKIDVADIIQKARSSSNKKSKKGA